LKILETNLKKGLMKLVPENLDDLWHLYNVIYPNDEVYTKTTRQVKPEGEYLRPQKAKRISVFLGVRVKKVLWDKTLNRLRVHGTVCQAPEELIGIGSYHTLNISVGQPLTIVKEKWQKHQLERLERASKPKTAPIIILSIDDEEYCIATLQQYGVETKVEERIKLPSKLEAGKRVKAKKGYFNKALKALKRVWAPSRNPVVVIGVGFIKNEFVNYVKEKSPEIAKAIVDVKGVNSSGVAGIKEALRSGVLVKALKHVRVVEEASVVEEVLERIGRGLPVAYGIDEVKRACNYGAIETLVLTDAKLRETSDEERVQLERIMREVEEKNGRVIVISTEHEAGNKLSSLGGIAAILRFQVDSHIK